MTTINKVSIYQAKWIGFKIVRGVSGSVSRKLKTLGFFPVNGRMGYDYAMPCGTDCCSKLAKMAELHINGISHVFTDANWMVGKITAKQASVNYSLPSNGGRY